MSIAFVIIPTDALEAKTLHDEIPYEVEVFAEVTAASAGDLWFYKHKIDATYFDRWSVIEVVAHSPESANRRAGYIARWASTRFWPSYIKEAS